MPPWKVEDRRKSDKPRASFRAKLQLAKRALLASHAGFRGPRPVRQKLSTALYRLLRPMKSARAPKPMTRIPEGSGIAVTVTTP